MVIFEFGYSEKYVVNDKDAALLMGIMARAERIKSEYKDNTYVYYVTPNTSTIRMEILSEAAYQMGKLAGASE